MHSVGEECPLKNNNKFLVVIRTAPTVSPFQEITWLCTEEELELAKKERPDLIFTKGEELPPGGDVEYEKPVIVKGGITVRGMTLPYDIEEQAKKILDESEKQ